MIESTVSIDGSTKGYIITIADQFSENVLAVTAEELSQIVAIGNKIIS